MRNNNIGTLRFIGAFLVLFGHSFPLSTGSIFAHDPISILILPFTPFHRALPGVGVMMFFVLSGYLITASYLKNNIFDFVSARILRVYPALIVVVLFCILAIGLPLTKLDASTYLTHKQTINYLLHNSSLIDIRFRLPGVFTDLPWKNSVNGSLWTLPIELWMYILVVIAGLTGLLKNKIRFNIFCAILILLFIASPDNFPLLSRPQHAYLGLSFLTGAFLYINKDKIPVNTAGVFALIVLCTITWKTTYYDFISLFTFAYAVLLIGFTPTIRYFRLDSRGDLSYGLYLYAFPLQQLSIYHLGDNNPWLINIVALCGALTLATLSWHFIEKPMMAKKEWLSKIFKRCYDKVRLLGKVHIQ